MIRLKSACKFVNKEEEHIQISMEKDEYTETEVSRKCDDYCKGTHKHYFFMCYVLIWDTKLINAETQATIVV